MKYQSFLPCACLFFIWTACNTRSKGQIPTELKEAMQARLEAVWKKDIITWNRLTSEEFTVVVPEGMLLTKEDRMAGLKNENPQPVHAIEQEKILTYGETVVRRFIDENEWVLEVWIKQDGDWKVLATQVNYVKNSLH